MLYDPNTIIYMSVTWRMSIVLGCFHPWMSEYLFELYTTIAAVRVIIDI